MLSDAFHTFSAVGGVHHVHAWSITSGRDMFSAHLRVGDLGRDGEHVLQQASALLKERFGVYFSTLQIEERCLAAEQDAAAIDITQRHEHAGR